VAQKIIEKYLKAPLDELDKWVLGQVEMDKEDVLRLLRQIFKMLHGCSELLPTISIGPLQSSVSKSLKFLQGLNLTFENGFHVRETVLKVNIYIIILLSLLVLSSTDSRASK
jgi:hypothetical protein